MANDISVYSLNAAAPVSRRESVSSVKELPSRSTDQVASRDDRAQAVGGARQAAEKQDLEQSVKDLNALVQELQRELNFSVDEASGEMVVKVVDRQTEEVVRQIPSEEVLRLRQRLEQATGALFSDKV